MTDVIFVEILSLYIFSQGQTSFAIVTDIFIRTMILNIRQIKRLVFCNLIK